MWTTLFIIIRQIAKGPWQILFDYDKILTVWISNAANGSNHTITQACFAHGFHSQPIQPTLDHQNPQEVSPFSKNPPPVVPLDRILMKSFRLARILRKSFYLVRILSNSFHSWTTDLSEFDIYRITAYCPTLLVSNFLQSLLIFTRWGKSLDIIPKFDSNIMFDSHIVQIYYLTLC